jgi:hypothetical protein
LAAEANPIKGVLESFPEKDATGFVVVAKEKLGAVCGVAVVEAVLPPVRKPEKLSKRGGASRFRRRGRSLCGGAFGGSALSKGGVHGTIGSRGEESHCVFKCLKYDSSPLVVAGAVSSTTSAAAAAWAAFFLDRDEVPFFFDFDRSGDIF